MEPRAYQPDKRLCVVTFLEEYVRRTLPLRGSSRLLISYEKPHDSVTTDTFGSLLAAVFCVGPILPPHKRLLNGAGHAIPIV